MRSPSSVSSVFESWIVLMKEWRISHGSGLSNWRNLSVKMGGRTAAFRICLETVVSGRSVFRLSTGSECVLMRAVRDGVWISSVLSVAWRWSTFSCMGKAVDSKPVKAKHLICPVSRNVGPVAWWKNDGCMLLSKGSSVNITTDGIDWIEARFANFSALVSDLSKMLIMLPHSCWRWRFSS